MNFNKQPENNPYNDRSLEQLMPLLAEPENMTSVARIQLFTRVALLFDNASPEQRNQAIELLLALHIRDFKKLEKVESILDKIVETEIKNHGGVNLLSEKFLEAYELFKEQMDVLKGLFEKKHVTFTSLASHAEDLGKRMKILTEICKRPEIKKVI
jgi:hypothetical protein